MLEADAASRFKQRDKVLIWFLAATQYYLGGHYNQAAELCRKIEARLLPERVHDIYRNFLKDVRERSKPDYVERMCARIPYLWSHGEYQQIIDMLKDHHYVLPESDLALARGVCCAKKGDYLAAAVFCADVPQKRGASTTEILYAAVSPLFIKDDRGLNEAWVYSQCLLKYLQHPMTYFACSLLRSNQAFQTSEEAEKRLLYKEQLHLFQEAESRLAIVPPLTQSQDEYQKLIALALIRAATAASYLEDDGAAMTMLNRAIGLNPSTPVARWLRGSLTFPNPESLDDFRKAIELGAKSYVPYAYLAADALQRGDFAAAVDWVRKALLHRPDAKAEARLRQYMDIAVSRIDASKDAETSKPFEPSSFLSNEQFSDEDSLRSNLDEFTKHLSPFSLAI